MVSTVLDDLDNLDLDNLENSDNVAASEKPNMQNNVKIRNDWTYSQIEDLYNLPFADLLFTAQQIHRMEFNPNQVQKSTLLSIKTGSCPEDCKYCPQSGHYHTKIQKHKLMSLEQVRAALTRAKQKGASRFCMGAAWRSMPKKELEHIGEMVKLVKAEGLESCLTLGMLNDEQVGSLKDSGLDYYNHNLDTSPEYYEKIITTRTYQERLDTLDRVRTAGIKVCCGGIVGMGESFEDRVKFIQQLANLPKHPESVPINRLVPVAGTPLGDELINNMKSAGSSEFTESESSESAEHNETSEANQNQGSKCSQGKGKCESEVKLTEISEIDFVKTIAVARITMPKSYVRLSAGRETMSDSMQAMCFLAGANSIFYGEKLLTTANPSKDKDMLLFEKLGIESV